MVQVKDPVYTANGHINVYYNHPTYGYIPYTAVDGSGDETAQSIWDAAIALGPAPYETPAPTDEDINVERERRILAGNTFTIEGVGDVAVIGDEQTRLNLGDLSGEASLLETTVPEGTIVTYFRDALNVTHAMTAPQMKALYLASMAYTKALYGASWALKDSPPIPADYQDDTYWPTAIPPLV